MISELEIEIGNIIERKIDWLSSLPKHMRRRYYIILQFHVFTVARLNGCEFETFCALKFLHQYIFKMLLSMLILFYTCKLPCLHGFSPAYFRFVRFQYCNFLEFYASPLRGFIFFVLCLIRKCSNKILQMRQVLFVLLGTF